MSQDYHHQSLASFSNGFERLQDEQQQQQYMAHQIQREKLRVEGFELQQPLISIEEGESNGIQVYESAGILSEMFNFHTIANCNSDSVTAHYHEHQQNQIPSINTAEAMKRTSSTLQGHFSQFICGDQASTSNPVGGVNVIEGQGLSLSLSSSLQHLEEAKVEELRVNSGRETLFFNRHHFHHVGFGSSLGLVNLLRNSKYAKAAQELLEEFCSVGRGQLFKASRNNNTTSASNHSGSNNNPSSSKVNPPNLPAADRLDYQRTKVKLLSMLDEVDKRYNHYCEQMQMVVNSFDLVMGLGAAVPYTSLAQKAMSRHFKCLKDGIAAQLKQTCELLGEKDATTSGLTKGETPRLKVLEQTLRQQRAFQQMGIMEQEDNWRPQRGLPERSVNILRAWLFEHFLHPVYYC